MVSATPAPDDDLDPLDVVHTGRKEVAVGVPAVATALSRSLRQMGPVRTARTLVRVNQLDGFDCMGCAWPDPVGHRSVAEFCENGAKAVAEEATTRRVGPEFFARHSLSDLEGRSGYWLGEQGRLTHPMVRRPGREHYEPISWDEAFALVGDTLRGLASPDEALFYTSGRASNEAAFLYQLFARALGTNNLPDCSNMCHESTSVALADAIGIGKGSVSLADIHQAELIVVIGQNPGTNHPRMLSALETAKRHGARIMSINPLPEAGLQRFKNPQNARGVLGPGTELTDEYLLVRTNGDQALFQALGALLLQAEETAAAAGRPGTVIDHDFLERHTQGFAEWAEHLSRLDRAQVLRVTGLAWSQIERAAALLAGSRRTVFCWAMGLTQHRNAVATLRDLVNLALMQGNIGRPGAGLCPVRGHSNVQGDRTMGIWEQIKPAFADALAAEFGFEPPREPGLDTVKAIRALRDGKARVFVGLGGNFVSASPDTAVTEAALRSAELTVQISTKLNRSHVVAGRTALILPTLGRTERDLQDGRRQSVSVEDSMSSVHLSHGCLEPAGELLRSEVAIIAGLAQATLRGGPPGSRIDWAGMAADYRRIREHIGRVVPGCVAYADKVEQPGGFVLPHPPRDSRTFPTASGRAEFGVNEIDEVVVPPGHLLLQSLRSHDQFNTTIYGYDDRYRGIKGGRNVVLVNPSDLAAQGFAEDDLVDLVGTWTDGSVRVAERFRVVAYATPPGCAAAYYPEVNVLVPLDSTAIGSNCPTSKSVVVRLVPAGQGAARPEVTRAVAD